MPQLLRGRFAAHCVGQTTQISQLAGPHCGGCQSRRWVIPHPVAQMGYEFEQLGMWDFWPHQGRFACFIDAMHSEDVLGEINYNGYDSCHLPYQVG